MIGTPRMCTAEGSAESVLVHVRTERSSQRTTYQEGSWRCGRVTRLVDREVAAVVILRTVWRKQYHRTVTHGRQQVARAGGQRPPAQQCRIWLSYRPWTCLICAVDRRNPITIASILRPGAPFGRGNPEPIVGSATRPG
jgi:hypothetical protein